jgi:hypothetical protein
MVGHISWKNRAYTEHLAAYGEQVQEVCELAWDLLYGITKLIIQFDSVPHVSNIML